MPDLVQEAQDTQDTIQATNLPELLLGIIIAGLGLIVASIFPIFGLILFLLGVLVFIF